MMIYVRMGLTALGVGIGLGFAAHADTIDPETFSATLAPGESVDVEKTVTTTPGTPSGGKLDVFFLSDITGSMTGEIRTVKSNASSILSQINGTVPDSRFGVGSYGDSSFDLQQDLTADTSDVQSAIDDWSAFGGGDIREANYWALQQSATQVSWRDGSARQIVWFGDAPGQTGKQPSGSTPANVTPADAIDALVAENVTVNALDAGSLNTDGDAEQFTDATGGTLSSFDSDAIVDDIVDSIEASFEEFSTVALDLSDVPDGIGASVDPGEITGDFDRSEEREFMFTLTLAGIDPGEYDFTISALVDGAVVATEMDSVVVTPLPAAAVLFGTGLAAVGAAARRRRAHKG